MQSRQDDPSPESSIKDKVRWASVSTFVEPEGWGSGSGVYFVSNSSFYTLCVLRLVKVGSTGDRALLRFNASRCLGLILRLLVFLWTRGGTGRSIGNRRRISLS